MKKIPFVLYAGDSQQEGTLCGTETLRRIKKAVSFIACNRNKFSFLVLGAGIRPDKPHYPPLKKVMKECLENHLNNFPIVTTEIDGWGTFKESLAIYAAFKEGGQNEIYLCSSWYHIPRILTIWFMINRKIKIHVVCAPSPRISSVLTEILSFIKLFIDWYKWKKHQYPTKSLLF